MKKLNMKVISAVFSVLILAYMSGCSKTSAGMAAGTAAGSNSTASQGPAAQDVVSGYPITTTPLTLSLWTVLEPSESKFFRDRNDHPVYQEYEKRTGIHIDFIHPPVGQDVEAFNVLMASGEFPDMINVNGGRYIGGESAGVNDGVFVDLTNYIPQYAPDYYKLVTGNSELNREVRDSSGRYIGFYKIKPIPDPPFRYVMYRTEQLKKLGFDTPQTLADYEKLLPALKNDGTTPLMLPKDGYEEQFFSMYDVRRDFYLGLDGSVKYGQIEDGFKSYLALMNKWYSAGYIGKDFPGIDTSQQQPMFDNGSLGLIIDACVVTYNRDKQLGISVDSAPYPRLTAGQMLHWNYSDAFPQGGELTLVTTSSKHIPEACRWLNYGFTDAGALLLNYGIEGKTWNYVNGVPTFTQYALTNPDFPGGDPNLLLKVTYTAKLTFPDVDCSINLAVTPESRAIRMKYMNDPLLDKALILPPYQMTTDESTEVSRIMGDIKTYCDEMTLKFITGDASLDQWDAYVKQVKAMGIDRAVQLQQTAYDRYMKS